MNTIRTAVIGTGYLGKYHVDKFATLPQSQLIAICDIDATHTQELSGKYHISAIHDYRSLIGQADAVSIATPTPLHFEIAQFFLAHDVHVLIEKPTLSKNDTYDLYQLDPNHPIVTLLPGSRRSELNNHLPIMIESVKKIAEKIPHTQFVLALANHFDPAVIAARLPNTIRIIQNHLYDVLQISNAAIAVSGTVTLEVGLMQVPMCILYRFKPITYWIAKQLIRTKYIGLCNIVAEKLIAKEFIQQDATPENVSTEIIKLLTDKNYHATIHQAFSQLKSRVSIDQDSSTRVAEIAIGMLRCQ